MQNTTNYSLPTWEQDDQIKMSDFNALTAKLDAALKSHDTADANALAAVSAEASARGEAVSAEAQARANALSALQTALSAAIGSGGKTCRVFTGSYTGTGSGSTANPVSITCPFYPVLAFVQAEDASRAMTFFRAQDVMTVQQDFGLLNSTLRVTWGDSSVSWYSGSNGSTSSVAESSGNVRGKVYSYVVLGFDSTAE